MIGEQLDFYLFIYLFLYSHQHSATLRVARIKLVLCVCTFVQTDFFWGLPQQPSLLCVSASPVLCEPLPEASNRLVTSGDAAVKRRTNLRMSIARGEMSVRQL